MTRRVQILIASLAVSMASPVAFAEDEAEKAPTMRKVAAGVHSGDAFGPRVRPDGKWVAYGVREEDKGTFVTKYYARSLVEDGVFRSVWPNQHPSFDSGEGTASFTDLVGFEWSRDGVFDHNAMVAMHKTLGEEVLMETMDVRKGGPGKQNEPAIAPDGSRLVVTAETGLNTDLWVADTRDGADWLQITFTEKDNESKPSWNPRGSKVIFERRNALGADVWYFDFDTFEQSALTREGTSNEILPSYSPDNESFAYVTDGNDKAGLRWDLVVKKGDSGLPKTAIPNLRLSDKSRGYAWGPFGKFVIGVQNDEKAGYPIVIAPVDGSSPPVKLAETVDNMDPEVVAFGPAVRVTWVAKDMEKPEDRRFRVVMVGDYDVTDLQKKVSGETK
ncbi:MAG: PD40 domain-containing protein [Deltaproteobacteria bacterium]|nr:PD40 domain-containing protein [Deltaproteobacteria bacterium]